MLANSYWVVDFVAVAEDEEENFTHTRPKPPYGRQGLVGEWGKGNMIFFTNRGIQPTSFYTNNVTSLTGGSN